MFAKLQNIHAQLLVVENHDDKLLPALCKVHNYALQSDLTRNCMHAVLMLHVFAPATVQGGDNPKNYSKIN